MNWIRQNKLIVLLAIIKFLVPFILVNTVWELHRDEYLYYQQGQHLDFGYLENPSLIGLLAYISSLFGGSVFFIKFWPCLFGALTLIVTAGITKELGGKLFAQAVAATGIIFSAYMRIDFLFQPNFLDVFCWALGAYYLLRYINTQQNKYFYLLSFAIALGWWSKYSVAFFAGAIIASILLTKHRSAFIKKHFWYAVLFGLILIIPNIIWQYVHNFPLLHHMKELQETQLQYISKTDFIKEQIMMLLPLFVIWFAGFIWLLTNNKYRLIAYTYLIAIVLLMMGSGKSYYALGAYPMLLAGGGVWFEKISKQRIWIRYAVVSIILLLALPIVPLLLPMQSPNAMAISNQKYHLEKIGLLKWEDQQQHTLQQDFADMIGWKELATKAENFYHSLPPEKQENSMIFCSNYGEGGALKYYCKDNAFQSRIICANGSFILWIPTLLEFKNLIFIGSEIPGKQTSVFSHFEKTTVIDSVTDPLSRQYGDKVIFFENADSVAQKLTTEKLNKIRSDFER